MLRGVSRAQNQGAERRGAACEVNGVGGASYLYRRRRSVRSQGACPTRPLVRIACRNTRFRRRIPRCSTRRRRRVRRARRVPRSRERTRPSRTDRGPASTSSGHPDDRSRRCSDARANREERRAGISSQALRGVRPDCGHRHGSWPRTRTATRLGSHTFVPTIRLAGLHRLT